MKIKCINNNLLEGLLTLGKEYSIYNVTNRFYVIKNDKGVYSRYTKERFVVISGVKKEEVALVVHDSKLEEEKVLAEAVKEFYEGFVVESDKHLEIEPLMETYEPIDIKPPVEIKFDCERVPGIYEQIALDLGKLVDSKNAEYGDAINSVDKILAILYPNGIDLKDYRNASVLVRILDKIFRISKGNQGSENAFKDIAGYGILMSKEDK